MNVLMMYLFSGILNGGVNLSSVIYSFWSSTVALLSHLPTEGSLDHILSAGTGVWVQALQGGSALLPHHASLHLTETL